MISLVKPTPPKKIKAEIKTGFVFIGESTENKPDIVRCFLIKPLKKRDKK